MSRRERGRHRIRSRLQEPSCQRRARRWVWTYRLWDHDLSWSRLLNRLSNLGTPKIFLMFIFETHTRMHTHTHTHTHTQHTSGGGADREGDTESEAGFRPWAVSTEPATWLEPVNHEIMTCAEVGLSTDWDTQVPLRHYYYTKMHMSGWNLVSGVSLPKGGGYLLSNMTAHAIRSNLHVNSIKMTWSKKRFVCEFKQMHESFIFVCKTR